MEQVRLLFGCEPSRSAQYCSCVGFISSIYQNVQVHLGSLFQEANQEVAEAEDMRHSHTQVCHCSFHDDFAAVRAAKRDIWIACETTTSKVAALLRNWEA
jgi:hypothetical protein